MKGQLMSLRVSLAAALLLALSAVGAAADQSNTILGTNAMPGGASFNNTALGYYTLFNNTSLGNTAAGAYALYANTSGFNNAAFGDFSLSNNTTGDANTAVGSFALFVSSAPNGNTAVGSEALYADSTGSDNTAIGLQALYANNTGFDNTATGWETLGNNTGGYNNTGIGAWALFKNTTGTYNAASGPYALYSNNTGQDNTALGPFALRNNTTGTNNIGLGIFGGYNLTTGNNNIELGNPGVRAESNTIRIGKQGTQTATYIAGVSGVVVTGSDVVVAANGRMGVIMSSARYKLDLRDMGETSSKLMKLRPVTFRYKNDEQGTTQYGLVAEEVQRVYPELVAHGADGKVETVRYYELIPMLLNELQKQTNLTAELRYKLRNQTAANQRQAGRIGKLAAQVGTLNTQMAQEKISTRRRIDALQANHDRELRAMQAAFEQRLSALERTTGTGAPAAFRGAGQSSWRSRGYGPYGPRRL
jgi:hypothetical protein